MKTLEKIERDVLREIDQFVIPARVEGLIGTIWGEDRYAQEIKTMRKCLVAPKWCQVIAGGVEGVDPYSSKEERTFAMVANDGYYALFFDPATDLYALGFEEKGNSGASCMGMLFRLSLLGNLYIIRHGLGKV